MSLGRCGKRSRPPGGLRVNVPRELSPREKAVLTGREGMKMGCVSEGNDPDTPGTARERESDQWWPAPTEGGDGGTAVPGEGEAQSIPQTTAHLLGPETAAL